jgi:hypothetical protein
MEGAGENKANMRRPALTAVLLACLPFLAVCFSVPLWDRVYPMVLGLPFNLFWLMCWIPLTSVCLWGAYRLGTPRRHDETSPSGKSEPQ